MIVSARTTFAVRCPECGQMELTTLSRFALSGGQTARICCSCGSEKLVVGTRKGQVWLQIPCYLCEGIHFAYFQSRWFWGSDLKYLTCTETDLQLGVFGSEEAVDLYTRTGGSELERLLEDEAFGEYFDQPEVMYQVLSLVHTFAEEGNLRCACGNQHISVDIYPERLELICPACGRGRTISASEEEDITVLEQVEHLEVGVSAGGRRKGNKKGEPG